MLDFGANEQKSPEYMKLNPNGRIPTIVDHWNDDFVVWESNAMITYITEKYDKERRLLPETEAEKVELQTCECSINSLRSI